MMNVYATEWCPHCRRTISFLEANGIKFNVVDVEKASPEVVKKVVEANGGDDWVVPTIEVNGKWRPGKAFNASELASDLRNMGVEI